MSDNKDSIGVKIWGQILQFVSPHSGAKHFTNLLIIVGFFLVIFGLFGYAIIALGAFIFFALIIIGFMIYMAVNRENMFREDKYVVQLQRIQYGNKSTGVKDLPAETILYQPTIKKKITKPMTYEVKTIETEVVKL